MKAFESSFHVPVSQSRWFLLLGSHAQMDTTPLVSFFSHFKRLFRLQGEPLARERGKKEREREREKEASSSRAFYFSLSVVWETNSSFCLLLFVVEWDDEALLFLQPKKRKCDIKIPRSEPGRELKLQRWWQLVLHFKLLCSRNLQTKKVSPITNLAGTGSKEKISEE